jgi:hypothetical protein
MGHTPLDDKGYMPQLTAAIRVTVPELTNRETGEKQPNPNNEERYAFFC